MQPASCRPYMIIFTITYNLYNLNQAERGHHNNHLHIQIQYNPLRLLSIHYYPLMSTMNHELPRNIINRLLVKTGNLSHVMVPCHLSLFEAFSCVEMWPLTFGRRFNSRGGRLFGGAFFFWGGGWHKASNVWKNWEVLLIVPDLQGCTMQVKVMSSVHNVMISHWGVI